jgi:hypothetical protein
MDRKNSAGELEPNFGSRTGVLKKGDAFHFESRLPHPYCNVGS